MLGGVCGVGVLVLVVCCSGRAPIAAGVGELVCRCPCTCGPEGLLPLVVWWCGCVGGVLPGALPRCGLACW